MRASLFLLAAFLVLALPTASADDGGTCVGMSTSLSITVSLNSCLAQEPSPAGGLVEEVCSFGCSISTE